MNKRYFDLVIVGGGISGTSLLYTISEFTDIKKVCLIEKYQDVAEVNSHYRNNSQTLHFGDIETNYELGEALKLKKGATMIANFSESRKERKRLFVKLNKMVVAIGKKEVKKLNKRFEKFKKYYPGIKKLESREIAKIEPKIMEKRPKSQKIIAMKGEHGYAMNYKELTKSFLNQAKKHDNVTVKLNTKVEKIEKQKDKYLITTNKNEKIQAKTVAVNAGPHSLIFARKLGYGKQYGILSVAGSFYLAKNIFKSKVYAMQIKKLPFAAIHADLMLPGLKYTRFGPTAKVIPLLERHNYSTFPDFFKTAIWNLSGIKALIKVIWDKIIFIYVIKNLLYDIPWLGKWLFLQKAKKLVPSLKYKQLKFGKGIGGIRPQVVSTETGLKMKGAGIMGDNIIFSITPPTGASSSLYNAKNQMQKIIRFFDGEFKFNKEKFKRTLEKPI